MQTIEAYNYFGQREKVDATISESGFLAIHKSISAQLPVTITHIPTGRLICSCPSSQDALCIVQRIDGITDWDFTDQDRKFPWDIINLLWGVIEEFMGVVG